MRRLLLIPYPVLAAVTGLAYMFGARARTPSHSFDVARSIAPLQTWGLLFAAGAVVLSVALIVDNRRLTANALFIGGAIYTWWASLFAIATVTEPTASLVGWAVWGFVAFAHYVAAWRVLSKVGL